MLAIEDKCPYCHGLKRIRNDLIPDYARSIIQIENKNELWSFFITNKCEHRTMQYISYCPMCGRKLTND